jgi:hypothetical protein
VHYDTIVTFKLAHTFDDVWMSSGWLGPLMENRVNVSNFGRFLEESSIDRRLISDEPPIDPRVVFDLS